MKIAVTGASGFIGTHLVPRLHAAGHEVVPLPRDALAAPAPLLADCDALVHLAGLAGARGVPLADYRAVNTELPLRLAAAMREAGIGRMVFVSTSHVVTHPETPYARSKREAETRLAEVLGPRLAILRPAPVYGPGGKGNFRRLLQLARLPLPLPIAGIGGARSLVHVGNLADAIAFAAAHPGLDAQPRLVTDPGPAPALDDVVALLREGMGRSPGLWPWPLAALPARTLSGPHLAETGWTAPVAAPDALRLTAGR